MSAAARLPAIAGTLSVGALIAGLATLPSVRAYLLRYIGTTASNNMWRIAAVAFALVNLKNLPGFWHIRVLRGIIYQLYLQPTAQQPKHLFAPLITSTRNSLYDCDYNLHKSNSTYFADLDVARAHAVSLLIRTGMARLNRGDESGLFPDNTSPKGKYAVALGAVSCFFQKEIKPLEQYEIHTRVLSWDRKWLYMISHVVRKGAIKPGSYALQPWKKSKRRTGKVKKTKDEEDLKKHIFATSLARYVFKKGRLTINPEAVIERSRLLPPRPVGVGLPPRQELSSDSGTPTSVPATPAQNGNLTGPETVATEVSSRLGDFAAHQQPEDDDSWTWEDMESERLRGLKLAMHFDKLSALHGELRDGDALGEYGDYW